MRILMIASEATPFCKTGGLADVIGALPAALQAGGEEVAVVLPAYRVNRYPGPVREVYRTLRIALGKGYVCDVYECIERGVPFFFVDCPELFDREGLYGTSEGDYADNHLRYAVLCMAAVEIGRRIFRPNIFHCHDWQTGLLPVYLQRDFAGDPTFIATRTLFTIHNLGYQGLCSPAALPNIGLDPGYFNPGGLEFYGQVSLLKGGLVFADMLNTVSPTYSREIQTPEYGFLLDGLLRSRAAQLTGILNGVDYTEWNPETDRYLAANYSVDDLSGKRECKRALIEEVGLPPEALDRPLAGIVSRFAGQKGFDLIAGAANDIARLDLSLVVLGTGEERYESLFRTLAELVPNQIAVRIGYDNGLAHRIEAGSDMFLMPSRYEPCGLNQIYSLRYGTLPVVRATGGLDDTIQEGNGFKFWDYAAWALLSALQYSLGIYTDRERWTRMMGNAMRADFSWETAAEGYSALYRRMLAG